MQIAKLLKNFWRWIRLFLISRLDRPSDNLVVIIISLMPLIFNWDLNWSSKIIFEFDLFNKITILGALAFASTKLAIYSVVEEEI